MSEPLPLGELPAPSAELVLYRAHVQALVVALGPKKARLYLNTVAERLAREEQMASVVPIRAGPQRKANDLARREAMATFAKLLPIFLACLPPG